MCHLFYCGPVFKKKKRKKKRNFVNRKIVDRDFVLELFISYFGLVSMAMGDEKAVKPMKIQLKVQVGQIGVFAGLIVASEPCV